MGLSRKLEIYSICSIVYMMVLIFGGMLLQIFDPIFWSPISLFRIVILIYYIVSLWFVAVVYKDAKRRGLSRNWCFIIFFLLIFGAIIYYVHVKDKPKIEAEAKILEKEVKKLELECPECGMDITIKDTGKRPIPISCPHCGAEGEF